MSKKVALLIEDVARIRHRVEQILRRIGLEVHCFDGAENFLKELDERKVNRNEVVVVVSDLYDAVYGGSASQIEEDADEVHERIAQLQSLKRLLPDGEIFIFSLFGNLSVEDDWRKAAVLERVFHKLASAGIRKEHIVAKLGSEGKGFPSGYKLLEEKINKHLESVRSRAGGAL